MPPDSDPRPVARRHSPLGRIALIVFLVLVGLVVAVRWIGSPIARAMINKKLAENPDYTGEVHSVKIALWRGGVEANQFRFSDKKHPDNPPLLYVEEADLRLDWQALFRGKIGGQLVVDRMDVTVVKTEKLEDAKKKGDDAKQKMKELQAKLEPWQEALRKAMPLELSRFEMKDSRFRVIDRSKGEPAEIALSKVHVIATGLSNRREAEEMPAKLELTGTLTGEGEMKAHVQADPMAKAPRFTTTLEIKPLELKAWNGFLEKNFDIDVSSGTFEFYVEAEAKDGGYNGYVKPFFKDLDFSASEDARKNVGQKVKEAAADVIASLLKNKQEQKVATKVPFSGSFAGNQVDVWTAVQNLLRNAFVQALREGFDRPGPG